MGQSQTRLKQEELEEYQECTFFTKKEILHVHSRFLELQDLVKETQEDLLRNDEGNVVLTMDQILQLPELKVNPFRERICIVFSENKDGSMTFEDFLDMMSVFSEGATRDVKASYAFRIYDFNMDGYLDKHDLIQTIKCLCGFTKDNTTEDMSASSSTTPGHNHATQLSETEVELVADKILEEADLDGDHRLSYVEFEHVISRAPDFINTFRIRI